VSPATPGADIPVLGDPRLAEPDATVLSGCAGAMQATLLPNVRQLLVETEDGPAYVPTPDGAVVLSQTCDVMQANRHSVQVSPLAHLDGPVAAEAARENRPRYAPVWSQGQGQGPVGFADLEVVATWSKGRLAQERQVSASWHTSLQTRTFGRAVGRRFSRFAWPDVLQPWLRPLEQVLQKRYDGATSPAGRLVAGLQQVRVGADDWDAPELNLTLHFIFEVGVLPPSDLQDAPSPAATTLAASNRTWKQLAQDLEGLRAPADRYLVYDAMAAAWAALCVPPNGASHDVLEAVTLVTAEIWSADEFSVDMARSCPNVDVDYVSAPATGVA